MRPWRAALADSFLVSLLVVAVMAAGGVLALGLAWQGSAAEVSLANQLPFVVSGGFGGLGLLGLGAGVAAIQQRRWVEAKRRAELDDVVEAAARLLETARRAGAGEAP